MSDNTTLATPPIFYFTVKDSSDNNYYKSNGTWTRTTAKPMEATSNGIITITPGDGGETLTGLPIGVYTVEEVFISNITISGYYYSGTVLNEEATGVTSVVVTVIPDSEGDPGTEPVTVTAVNTYTAGVELPATGGPGTLMYTIGGLAMILLAGVLLLSRRKRKNI